MDAEKRNKIIIGGLVAVVVVVTVVILFRMGNRNQACALVEEAPSYNSSTAVLKLIATDNSSLVQLFGHLKSADNSTKDVFLNLVIESVALNASDATKPVLSLKGPCVQVVMNMQVTTEQKVDSIEISRTEVNGNVEKCTVKSPADFTVGTNQHYKCALARSYECSTNDKDGKSKVVATLVLDYIEFQVNGNKDKIGKGEYTTDAKECAKQA